MRRAAALAAMLVAGCGSLLGIDGGDDEPIVEQSPFDAASSDTSVLGSDGATTTPADDPDAGADAAKDATLANARRVVFVTDKTTTGAFGGLPGGDTICMAEAVDAGLPGTFVAWLSGGAGAAAVNARDRVAGDAGWFLTGDGGQVFAHPSDIVMGSAPKVGIARNARGQTTTGEVWTGTDQFGALVATYDCAGWTADDLAPGIPGTVGAIDSTWTYLAAHYCSESKRLYCFQR